MAGSDNTLRAKPASMYSYDAPMVDERLGNSIIAVLRTGSQTLAIKGVVPDNKLRPLWTADVAHINAICALMSTGRDDDALHKMHVAVVCKMVEHMNTRAGDTMMTVRALNIMLAESQRTHAMLSARVAELETMSDAQFDWAEM